ncbi:MAG: isochorismatase family protein [Methylotenera sp.]|nr:isochorismatase family protein [Methylotenera sp.]PKO51713.1 MAG: hydrolase [Betaproteobacteria bacterium HGW-Betaproteobacteria-20]
MISNLTTKADLSQLILVDMQTRLIAVMPQEASQVTIKNAGILAQAAAMLEVPIILTEQYPKGLGNTASEILAFLPDTKPVEKLTFSCVAEPKFSRQLTRDRSQAVLAGMEAHICILQTAMSLLATGKQVFVAEDAIISRDQANKANAIARMRDAGCIISNTESIVFEWLGKAEGDAFKAISKLIR